MLEIAVPLTKRFYGFKEESEMIKKFTMILGVVLSAVGVVGWFTGGHDHTLVIFGINMAHNMVHVLSGAVALLAVMGGEQYSKTYCLLFGAVYGLVTLAGFLNVGTIVSLLNLNMADNLLHLAISVACFAVGMQAKK